jgi:hypothetical protein
MMEEFQTRFTDFEIMKNDITLFHNPFIVVNEEQPGNLQFELCDLQADPILSTMKGNGMDLFKIFPKVTFTIKRLLLEDEFYVRQHVLM